VTNAQRTYKENIAQNTKHKNKKKHTFKHEIEDVTSARELHSNATIIHTSQAER